MPLDLHVLGLPLAFILSQDQTLHCISLNVCPTPGNPESPHQNGSFLILRCRYNMYMNFLILLKTESNYITSIVPSVFALYLVGKAAANLQLFSKPASFFWKKKSKHFLCLKNDVFTRTYLKTPWCFSGCKCKTLFWITQCFFCVFFNPIDSSKQYVNLPLNLSKKNKPFVVFGLQM